IGGGIGNEDHPDLSPFAQHRNLSGLEINIFHIQSRQFRNPQSGRKKKLQDRPVSQSLEGFQVLLPGEIAQKGTDRNQGVVRGALFERVPVLVLVTIKEQLVAPDQLRRDRSRGVNLGEIQESFNKESVVLNRAGRAALLNLQIFQESLQVFFHRFWRMGE